MEPILTQDALRTALPDVTTPLKLAGLEGAVDIYRDAYGIPHVRATTVHDAFFGQGFVHAQDRLWHMDADRRRAYGRWAEWVGASGLAQDVQMRRFRLVASARADYATLNADTRGMLEAYAAGVNAFVQTTRALPIEYSLVDDTPEPWQPWDSLAVFKVRHILMGVWQAKAWRARLLRHLGAARTAQLCPGYPAGHRLIVPPETCSSGPPADGLEVLCREVGVLAHLDALDGGSNSWVIAGSRTASGKPLLAGDPHRALDTPNVYYQNHLACSAFDAIGLSFPGVPGFPHFGHNQHVAWCVTHAMADYQDLFIEHFAPTPPLRYEFRGAWRPAEVSQEVVRVRGAEEVPLEVVVTHHGPIIVGEPQQGYGLAFRYTATAAPNQTFEALLPMLQARSTAEMEDSMRPWVDPANNFLCADTAGNIVYRTRGVLPKRPLANAWVPVPGWTGTYEWEGSVPFEEMPVCRNPETGYIVTANNRITGEDYPHYIALEYAPHFRCERLLTHLRQARDWRVEDMATLHADCVSMPAQEWRAFLSRIVPRDSSSRYALETLGAWDGTMQRESVAPTIYTAWRERLMRDLMAPILGPLATHAFTVNDRGGAAHVSRLRARLTTMIREDDRHLLPSGVTWPEALAAALSRAMADLRQQLGDDPSRWQWGMVHRTQPQHPLSEVFPHLAVHLDPPSVPMRGDGDTVHAASFMAAHGYGVTMTSVARYAFDLADWSRSLWVVPLGASGHPGSPHYADQTPIWEAVDMVPMLYDWDAIARRAESRQTLHP
jgi:penicillin amidase